MTLTKVELSSLSPIARRARLSSSAPSLGTPSAASAARAAPDRMTARRLLRMDASPDRLNPGGGRPNGPPDARPPPGLRRSGEASMRSSRRAVIRSGAALAALAALGVPRLGAEELKRARLAIGLKLLNSTFVNVMIGERLGYTKEAGFKL